MTHDGPPAAPDGLRSGQIADQAGVNIQTLRVTSAAGCSAPHSSLADPAWPRDRAARCSS